MRAKNILETAADISYYNSRLFENDYYKQEEIKNNGGVEVKLSRKKSMFISKELAEQVEYRENLKSHKKYLVDYLTKNESKIAKQYLELIEIVEKVCREKLDTPFFDKTAKNCADIIESNVKFGLNNTLLSFKFGIVEVVEPTAQQRAQIHQLAGYYAQFEELDR